MMLFSIMQSEYLIKIKLFILTVLLISLANEISAKVDADKVHSRIV